LLISALVQSWLDHWAAALSRLPGGIALGAILLPVVLAIFSRRMLVLVSCTIGTIIAFCTFVAPSYAAVTLATGVYLGCVIIALSGIFSRRKAAAVHTDFAQLHANVTQLRRDVDNLLAAADRRFMSELRASTEERSPNISNIPMPKDPSVRSR
jgi:outer membrane murein-binding lipoprotein Lpp